MSAHIDYPDATIILNNDSRNFVRFRNDFKESKTQYKTKDSIRGAIAATINKATIMTESYKILAMKYITTQELIDKLNSLPVISESEAKRFMPNIPVKNQKTFMNQRELRYGAQESTEESEVGEAEESGEEELPVPKTYAESLESKGGEPKKAPVEVEVEGTKAELLADEGHTVNAELEEAVAMMKKEEVGRVEEYKKKVEEELKDPEYPAMVAPEKLEVNDEGGLIVGDRPAEETAEEAMARIDAEMEGLRKEFAGATGDAPITGGVGEVEMAGQGVPSDFVNPMVQQRIEEGMKDLEGNIVGGMEDAPEAPVPDVPAETIQSEVSPEATTTVPEVISDRKPKYHLTSIMYYFGSSTNPEWDYELENSVFSSEISRDDMVDAMDAIIDKYGTDILVMERKSDTKNEYHELVQLMFCRMRNMHRGTRQKTAQVPISSLVGFHNKLAGQQMMPQTVGVDADGNERPQSNGSGLNNLNLKMQQVSPTVKIAQNQAIEQVLEAYRKRPYDERGKPRVNEMVANNMRGHRFNNIVGSASKRDPANLYAKGYVEMPVKVSKKPKTLKMPSDC